MHLLLITYQLKAPTANYSKLISTLKSSTNWWHYLSTTWLIVTPMEPVEYSELLKKCIYKGDRFFIVDITNQKRQGWLPQEAWDWIKKTENKIKTNG